MTSTTAKIEITPEQPRRGHLFTAVGAVGAAFLASLCCIGPVLFVTLGVGAGLASRFEPRGGCVLGVRKVLTRLDGVTKANVSYEKGNAVVTFDPQKTSVEQMIAAIKTLGYSAAVAG